MTTVSRLHDEYTYNYQRSRLHDEYIYQAVTTVLSLWPQELARAKIDELPR